jgi:peptide/nickel transport system substrate-binding protein
VRRALVLALDRELLVRAVLGEYGRIPYGPVSSQLWIGHGAPTPAAQDLPAARRLLAARGWVDRDGDGVREKSGVPLALQLIVPTSSTIRGQMSAIVQEQLRQVGVRIELVRAEPSVWMERHNAGRFDIDFSGAIQDPTPSGLLHSWSCDGPGNVGGYCDPAVDSLLERAILSPKADRELWHTLLQRIEESAPAAFLYSQTFVFAVNRRYRDVSIRPESSWISLWRWSVAGS